MTETRTLYRFNEKKEFTQSVIQAEDIEEKKIQGKTIFPIMRDATDIMPPVFNSEIEIPVFTADKWVVKNLEIKGVFYLKSDASEFDEIAIKNIDLYTEVKPLTKYSDGTTQAFKDGKWIYQNKGESLLIEEKKIEKLKELESSYNESKKITIQNGNTLIIKHDTPERRHFLANLPKLLNWSEISFFGNYKHSLFEYWQQAENGKIYGFSADAIIWSEVFAELFIDKSYKTLIFAQNKKLYVLYKNQILNADDLSALQNISFEKFTLSIVINIKEQAEKMLKKFKPSLLSVTKKNEIKKIITNSIKALQGEDKEIHLIKEQKI